MKLKELLLVSFISTTSLTGFGAQPSKPDFAFPKTVSENAEKALERSLKNNDGPAIVRALLDWGLARTAISPDNREEVSERMARVQARVKSPVTKAMIQMARADVLGNDTIAIDAINEFTPQLRQAMTDDWRSVVSADVRYMPSLYDFAVAMLIRQGDGSEQVDSIVNSALAWNSERVYPRFYLEYMRTDSPEGFYRLYDRFEANDVSAYAVTAVAGQSYSISERTGAYNLANRWLAAHSQSSLADEVRRAVSYLTRSSVDVHCPSVIAPGHPLKVKVNAVCLNDCRLEVRMVKPTPKTVATVNLHFDGTGVFESDTVAEVTLSKFGEYEIDVRFDGETENRYSRRGAKVAVTDFLLSGTFFGKKQKILPLDALNGALQSDVKVTLDRNRAHGARGADIYSPSLYVYGGSEPDNSWRYSANVLTDRAIYHPGDTVKFAATVMRARLQESGVLAHGTVEVEARNANYQVFDTLSMVTDDFGRISGSLKIPEDGLTGRFQLILKNLGSAPFIVSDYKAPTFEVELNSTRIDEKTVEVQGTAVGYNGFPIADASVAIDVRKLPVWVWFRNYRNSGAEVVAHDTVTTDSEGCFSARVTIPSGCNLMAQATATSPAGESHDASCFIASKKYFISADIPEFVLVGKAPLFSILDSKGEAADSVVCSVKLTSVNGANTVIPDKSWSNVPSGEYSLTAVAADADTLTRDRVCVYRRDDAMPPCESALFIPVGTLTNGDSLLVGTSYADSHILYTLWTPERILEQKWLTPAQGNFFLAPDLPEGVDNAVLSLSTLRNYQFYENNIKVSRPDQRRKLNIEVSSMRDRMTPGETETWTIKVKDNMGNPVSAAVMFDVYSKALDALAPFRWGLNTPYLSGKYFSQRAEVAQTMYDSASRQVKNPVLFSTVTAGFDLYGRHWPGIFVTEYEQKRLYMASAKAAPTMARNMMAMDDMDGAVVEEAAEADESASTTGADAVSGTNESDQYRLPEVPVALWAPVLNTNASGELEIRFVAPNANTTWCVNALAYDSSLLSGLFSSEIVTSKPVMVQPQLPRFLRVGDSIEFRSMVMNNSDSARTVTAFFEIYNPLTDEVLHTETFNLNIEAGASGVIATDFVAPDATMAGVRVRATSGNFTDGEQTVLPILPADVTVRTGQPLFLPSDSTHAVVDVPRGGVMTFTANAVWECITALPGLQTSESKSALSLSASLFSTATARGLLRSYPAIGRAIARWQGEDSVLVSRLERNPDLKIALLSSTPWVGTAQTIDERMGRLSLLFDRKLIEKTITDDINGLAKLTRKGGLAWTADCDEPSLWITYSVLRTVAQLRRLGYEPESKKLATIVENAVKYLDKEVASEFAENKDAIFTDYVFIRSQFPEVRQSAPARRAAQSTVQHIVGHWRDMSLSALPMAAIVLAENGYASTARQLLESLRQHEAWKQTWLHPLMLEAFHRLEPSSAEVGQIRNYFIAQKQSTSWGDGTETSNLIAAILTSGADWLVPAENALSVKIDGHEVTPDASSALGEFRLDLPEGGKVEIAKGEFPAWGGVFSCSVDSIGSVKPFASDELKITRRMEGELKVGSKVKLILTLEASQPMDFVLVKQPRCAAFEPVDQLPSSFWAFGNRVYREPCSTVTNWFINRLDKGTTEITETFYVTAEGTFILAPAESQSQLAPEFQAHSAGAEVKVSE